MSYRQRPPRLPGLLDPSSLLAVASLRQLAPAQAGVGTSSPESTFVCPPGTNPVERRMLVTGYDNGFRSTGKRPGDKGYGIAKDGTIAGHGTIAAPRQIPRGTVMYIPGYGRGEAHDIGGSIRGRHIDAWFPTEQKALEWGAPWRDVTLCLPPQPKR